MKGPKHNRLGTRTELVVLWTVVLAAAAWIWVLAS